MTDRVAALCQAARAYCKANASLRAEIGAASAAGRLCDNASHPSWGEYERTMGALLRAAEVIDDGYWASAQGGT